MDSSRSRARPRSGTAHRRLRANDRIALPPPSIPSTRGTPVFRRPGGRAGSAAAGILHPRKARFTYLDVISRADALGGMRGARRGDPGIPRRGPAPRVRGGPSAMVAARADRTGDAGRPGAGPRRRQGRPAEPRPVDRLLPAAFDVRGGQPATAGVLAGHGGGGPEPPRGLRALGGARGPRG